MAKAIDKVNGDGGRLHRFTAWMRTTGLTARQLDTFTGTNMGGHYLTAATQPAIPTPALWALIRPHCGAIPLWVDELVQRIEAEREVTGARDVPVGHSFAGPTYGGDSSSQQVDVTAPATAEAAQWAGYGTSLKPGHEPICVARKPLDGTVAGNVLKWGTGGVNIDAMRIGTDEDRGRPPAGGIFRYDGFSTLAELEAAAAAGGTCPNGRDAATTLARVSAIVPSESNPAGRWPANVVLDEETAAALDQQTGDRSPSARTAERDYRKEQRGAVYGDGLGYPPEGTQWGHDDTGGPSRYFYTAKAPADERITIDGVSHVTVKPLDLMRWLVRGYAGPKGALILDPFAGSGTTGEAAIAEGMRVVLIEQDASYLPLIKARVTRRTDPVEHLRTVGEDLGLFGLDAP